MFSEQQPLANADLLIKVIDQINKSRLGKVWFAGEGIDNQSNMRRKMLSPAYPTRWVDLPIAQ
ncbi:DUF4113 domain-containing protein [Pantoea agglomerans]|uniref:DUF4113 domain-containing protein n=1 Tax=Enterobacter agglomerans TaxID=549 RepID=UPI0017855FC3